MLSVNLDMYQSSAVAAVVILLGRWMVKNIAFLSKYCIPVPIAGGCAFALVHWVLRMLGIIEVSIDTTLMYFFMMVFFCSVGFNASVSLLKKGSVQVLMLTALVALLCLVQNIIGVGLAYSMDVNPFIGLCAGSVSLLGGHGTAGSYGPMFESLGIQGASAVAIASATYGLVAGCMIGGPLAVSRIRKFNLHSNEEELDEVVTKSGKHEHIPLDGRKFINATLLLAISIGIGTVILTFINGIVLVPMYIGALLVAVILRNVLPERLCPTHEIGILGELSLALFLGMAMMNLKLWELASLALPMIVILVVQTGIMALFAYFVVFRMMGKNYDAAVMTAGICGFGLGATPNAMANMEAIVSKFGPSTLAYLVIPIVGALFVDLVNAGILTVFMNLLK